MNGPTLEYTLARAVVDSMSACGVMQDDFLTGAIQVTNCSWQAPPLVTKAPLMKLPLDTYLEVSTWVNADQMFNLWSESMMLLRNAPEKVLNPDGTFRRASTALPHAKPPLRALALTVPDGFPGGVSDYAGVTLSVEVAHLMKNNAKLAEFRHDDDNYLAILSDGREIGIKDGLPAVAYEEWDLPVHGMITELLEMPRGAIFEGCDYDIISKTRSLVVEGRFKLPERDAIEMALQALRLMNSGKALLRAIQSQKTVAHSRNRRLKVIREAREVAYRYGISDRARIDTIRGLLVPEFMGAGKFTKHVYPYSAVVPALLAEKVLTRLRANLDALVEQEEQKYAISS